MSKKQQKNPSAGQNRWESALLQCFFEEDTWKANIQFVIEGDRLDETHIKALKDVVTIPLRRKFSYLHKNDLMSMVMELGNPKNKKPPKVPQFSEITETIFGLQNANQEIPLPLWAKLIKFGLLNIKDEEMRKREGASAKEKTAKGSAKKRARSKSPGKKGKKTPEAQVPKKDWSSLKKRGEEDNENKYIDDEPDNGPHHYILISGFRKPQLLPILDEIGIHINGVIKIQSENYEVLKQLEKEKQLEEEPSDESLAQIRFQQENLTKEIALFWKLLPVLLDKAPAASRLHDCGLHEYKVRSVYYPENWKNPTSVVKYGTNIFEDVACKIYDSLDWHRQYANYLLNINLLHVAEFAKEDKSVVAEDRATPQIPAVTSQQGKKDKFKMPDPPQVAVEEMVPPITPPPKVVDTRYYQDLMNSIPMESVSVSLVMHCMLEQVVATEEDKTPPNEKKAPLRDDGIHLALADCIAQSLDGLYLNESDQNVLSGEFSQFKQKIEETKEKNKIAQGPVLLHFGDDVSIRTNHLKEINAFNPEKSEISFLNYFPSSRLLTEKPVDLQKVYERMSRLHELHRHTCSIGEFLGNADVMSERAVDRLLELFVFESMNVTMVDDDGNLLPSQHESDNPWDDPYTKAAEKYINETSSQEEQEKGSLESSEKLNEEDLQLKYFSQQRVFNDYIYSETFKTPVLIQMLEQARQFYPCMEIYHSNRDNATYVMFHHPMSEQFHSKSSWNTCLHSDVGFRNYLELVADRITSWTKVQEQKFQAEQLALELEKLAQAAAEQSTPPPTAKQPKSGKNSKKGSRKGSPGRKGSPSRASSKAGSNEPSIQFSTPFVRSGSLKAESEMQAKAKEEEERVRREKESKQSARRTPTKEKSGKKSPGGKSPGTKTPTGKDSQRSKSGKKSPKSRSRSNSIVNEPIEKPEEVPEQLDESPILPFTGYDLGNNLVHIHGDDYYLYPCDGGIVKVEKLRYEHGQTSVKATTYKDGHVFALNIVEPMDPKDEVELAELLSSPDLADQSSQEINEKADVELAEKRTKQSTSDDDALDSNSANVSDMLRSKKTVDDYHSLFSSWCATLCDGMTLSLSAYGPDGICSSAVKAKERLTKILSDVPPASSPTPPPPNVETPKKGKKSPKSGRSPKVKSPRAKSPKGKKSKDAEKDAEAQRQEEQRLQEELERKLQETRESEELERLKKKTKKPKFQQLYTSCPDGLTIRFDIDDSATVENSETCEDEYKLLVRQSYPYKTSGKQSTEQARLKPAMDELSRLMLSDGRVVKIMNDGSTMILYADGTVCFNPGSGPIATDNRVPVSPASAQSGGSNQQNQHVADEMRVAAFAGSKKGSKGGKSSARTLEASVTETSIAGTLGVAAGLEAEAGAKLEADLETASSWLTTSMSGEVTVVKSDGTVTNQRPVLCYTATDPVTKEVMITREDKVVRVDRPDGSSVCEHTDGTRITRFCREEPEEQGESTTPHLTWYVRIECPGYATVTFNSTDQSCTATFGSGSTLTCTTDGSYQLLHWNGGRLDVTNDASVMYTPRPNNDLLIAALSNADDGEAVARKLATSKPEALGSYLMRHNADVCCEALDHEGNVFQVKSCGDVNVISSESIKNNVEDGDELMVPQMRIDPSHHHPPRLFVIHQDGTGTELLRYKDIQEYIGDAELDPVTAVIREPLPEDIDVMGITVMKPHFGNSGDAWVLQKEEASIVPPNLKTRDLTKFPSREIEKIGPPFATTVGKGLAIGSAPRPVIPPPAPMCPHALELRQLLQHKPISQAMRHHVASKVFEYGKAVCEQVRMREKLKLHEPRSSEEQMRARDLLQIVLEFDEKQINPPSPEARPVPSAITAHQNSVHSLPNVVPDKQDSPAVRIKYEATVAPHPPPVIPPPKPKLTEEDWEMIKRELIDEKLGRTALRNRTVPPYFEGEEGRAWLLTQATDLKEAQRHLVADPRKDGSEVRLISTNNELGNEEKQDISPVRDVNSSARGSSNGVLDTSSKVRPTNPTPAHASGRGTPTKVRPDNPTPFSADARQRNQRPSNPTPSHACIGTDQKGGSRINVQYQPSPIPENPTSADQRESQRDDETILPDSSFNTNSSLIPIEADSDFVITKSLLFDVTGQSRKDRVRLPASILSDKPGAVVNEKFMKVEEEVRRKVKTASVGSGLVLGNYKNPPRGFQLFPPEVVFGVLREGTTYSSVVRLKNVGVDSCRFKIKQPPPGTGVKVHYMPGPVAAGMDTKLEIEIYAIAVGVQGDSGVGTISHQLEITTEAEIIHLPISALILPPHQYDNRTHSMPSGHKAPGVRVCSNKPPLRDGIVRPHKIAS